MDCVHHAPDEMDSAIIEERSQDESLSDEVSDSADYYDDIIDTGTIKKIPPQLQQHCESNTGSQFNKDGEGKTTRGKQGNIEETKGTSGNNGKDIESSSDLGH